MVSLFIEPVDVWLFRDGKPFDAGLHHRAESLFPPFPTVTQGAVRSHQLVRNGISLTDPEAIKKAVGTTYDLGNLQLVGPVLARRITAPAGSFDVERLFPQPADAQTTDEESHRIKPASSPRIPEEKNVLASAIDDCPMLIGLDDAPEKGERGLWLTRSALLDYLQGNEVSGIPGKDLFVRESRMSNALDSSTRTTKTGMLYEVEFIRCRPGVGLLIEMKGEGYEWHDEGIIRLGGQMRAATYAPVRVQELPLKMLPKKFRMYFSTPAYFSQGWLPKSWDAFFDGKVELRAAAVGRYLSVGGFDLADKAHKPSRRYVPAGSVYYFECVDENVKLQGKPITDNSTGTYEAQCGFGQTIIAEWKDN